MSNIPAELRFAESHEWARLESDGTVTVGISDHAQEALGDVVFVELPEIGKVFAAADTAGVVESVKAASDIYSPVAGEVIEVNTALGDAPSRSTANRTAPGSSSSSQATPTAIWPSCWMQRVTRAPSANNRLPLKNAAH